MNKKIRLSKTHNKLKIIFQEDLSFSLNDFKLEFKGKNNKILETIQSETTDAVESNVIKLEDKKNNLTKNFIKNKKKVFYRKNKKKTK